MGSLLESLKKYFENTPQDILDNEWKEIEELNEIGPDVIEYAEYVKSHFNFDVPYSEIAENVDTHKFDVPECVESNCVSVDATYYFAA
jgi:hypothetical protein